MLVVIKKLFFLQYAPGNGYAVRQIFDLEKLAVTVANAGAGAGTSTYKVNFGNPLTTISSGNADANGYGNFEYAVPSGYFSLCSKNLAEHG
mgnify:CR=1 FL=1